MKILYLGTTAEHSTSLDRARALERLGHEVRSLDPTGLIGKNRWLRRLHHRSGFRLLQGRAVRWLDTHLTHATYDVAWINAGEVWGPAALRRIRTRARLLLNYNNDDPFGERDGHFWDMYRRSLPEYDLVCVLREVNVREARSAGARRVLRVWMSYDPIRHAPLPWSEEDARQWGRPVVFVGTWMPERGPFLTELMQRGVPLAVFGNRWEKAPEWPVLRSAWVGPGLLGTDYVKAIQYAQVCLGLLSKENRDQHTRRSVEIPFIGGLLCAERTEEHLQMYAEDKEAVFWANAGECASRCRWLLDHDSERRAIAGAGRSKVMRPGFSNDDAARQILGKASTLTRHDKDESRPLSAV